MTNIKEKDFIRTFILELILVQKESAFDLWDDENIVLPNAYMNIFDEILNDDLKKVKYSTIIPVENIQEWKFNINKAMHEFAISSGVKVKYDKNDMVINLDRNAITKIMKNDKMDYSSRAKIAVFAEDFLIIKNKVKPKVKQMV